MSEELTYEQKVNKVKELSSCYDIKDDIEICDHEKMKNIMDYKLNIDLEIIKGIFESDFKKASLNDDDVKKILNDFYKNHPFLIPFVGKDYPKNDKKKFLYVLESHYLPEFSDVYANMPKKSKNKNKWLKEQWYKHDFSWENLKSSSKSEISLYREDIEYMWTERVVKNNIKFNNRFKALFENMLNIKKEEIERAVKSIAFMNYFLRPAEHTGASIKYEYIDSLFSYLNLIRVWKALDEPNIIICSSKAKYSFNSNFKNHKDFLKKENTKENTYEDKTNFTEKVNFCLCNHPSNMSWNRKRNVSKEEKEKYRLENEYTTSDEILRKFKELI